jgi:hypothetical protein
MRPERAARILANIGSIFLGLLLLLRVLSLVDSAQAKPVSAAEEPVLLTYRYTFSEDGERVTFHQVVDPPPPPDEFQVTPEWFSMSVEGGPITTTEEPEVDLRPFVLRSSQIFLLTGDGTSLATGSQPDTRVTLAQLAPNREAIAFHAIQQGGKGGVYVLDASGRLDWLGDENLVSAIAWSPDSQRLAYIAPRERMSQVFSIDRTGRSLRQVTGDPAPKTGVAWYSDSQSIVYTSENAPSSPAEPTSSIWLAGPEGSEPVLLAGNLGEIHGLQAVNNNSQLAFTRPTSGQPGNEQLFLLDPETHAVRRVYPPYSIENLQCPVKMASGKEGSLRFELANTSRLNTSVPVILRAGMEPLPVQGERDLSAVRVEAVDVSAEGTSTVEWPVKSDPGLFTHFSLLIDQGEVTPMDEAHCVVANTYLGLPRLDFLPLTLPLIAPGMLLMAPWLRHEKKRWLWALWLAYPAVIAVMVAVESGFVRRV